MEVKVFSVISERVNNIDTLDENSDYICLSSHKVGYSGAVLLAGNKLFVKVCGTLKLIDLNMLWLLSVWHAAKK